MSDVSDFQTESYRIDQQIWDAIALGPGERALFLGLANEGAWIKRAVEIGVDVTAIGGDDATIARIEGLGATATRGSATMIPATESSYDVAVAMHYLHEIDPGFHAQVVSEMARVGKRVVIVEPSPPADALGKRIASLYGRAKREEGQFEAYQPLDYWRKLLAIVKAEVYQQLITFTRVPPRAAVNETISLILEALAIEALPERYLDELRALAARPDAQLLPLSRIVLVGTAAGEPLPAKSAEAFRPDVTLAPPRSIPKAPSRQPVQAAPAPSAPAIAPAPPPVHPQPQPQPQPSPEPAPHWTPSGFGFGPGLDEPELPPPPPLPAAAPPPQPRVAPTPPPQASPAAPFGAPFALPNEEPPFGGGNPAEQPASGFGWSWEPPEGPEEKP
ncbi:MAG TPA: hypothetical protein VGN14_08410 [Candidatus Elarobacter sp.]